MTRPISSKAVVVVLACLAIPGLSAAQDCVDYTSFVRLIKEVPTPIYAEDIAVQGNYAYVGASGATNGLYVVDVTDPASAAMIGSGGGGQVHGVAVSGSLAFVINSAPSTLKVFSLASPTAPSLLASIPTPAGTVHDVEGRGQYGYAAVGGVGLVAFGRRGLQATVPTPGYATGIELAGNYAYVACGHGGLAIIDISLPNGGASFVSSIDTPVYAHNVHVDGNYAYVADDGGGLQVIDVSVPASPVNVGSLQTQYEAESVDVEGSLAVIGCDATRIEFVDVSDPTDPQSLYTFVVGEAVKDVVLQGNTAYLATWTRGFQVLDVTNANTAPVLGSLAMPAPAQDMALLGNHAIVACQGEGLQMMDVSDATAPTIAATFDTPGEATGIELDGTIAYVADRAGGLRVIDVSVPVDPQLLGSVMPPVPPLRVAAAGGYVYTAGGFYENLDSFAVIDATDPEAPSVVATLPMRVARDVSVQGSYAYVADFEQDFVVVDISTPSAPSVVRTVNLSGHGQGLRVFGDRALLFNDDFFVHVIDISDPVNAAVVGSFPTPLGRWVISAALEGDVAYLGVANSGVYVYDISNPNAPEVMGTTSEPIHPTEIVLRGTKAYVADGWGGFAILALQCGTPISSTPTDIGRGSLASGLGLAWPNPAWGETTVRFTATRPTALRLDVYDVLGRHVRQLANGHVGAGVHVQTWDGRDAAQRPVARGVYYLRSVSADGVSAQRVTMLR